MICPHCSTLVKFEWESTRPMEVNDREGTEIYYSDCPNCKRLVVRLHHGRLIGNGMSDFRIAQSIWDKGIFPKEAEFTNSEFIPSEYLADYEEAVKVVALSPKASAALSRRILQSILRERFDIKKNSLAQEIQDFINMPGIPSHITDAVDVVRQVGNIAAHPIKDKHTGEIVPVEIGEAEWLIEVIEALFDFVFVQPIKLEKRKAELNIKLKNAGKPTLK